MLFINDVHYYYYAELRKDRLREAAQQRMLQQAGVDTRGWTMVQMHRMLHITGRLLVFLGRKLQRLGKPTATYSHKTKLDMFV